MTELDQVQRWMQSVISHPDGIAAGADADEAQRLIAVGAGNLDSVVTRSRRLSAADRLAIYGNAYYARLLDCLGEVFPILKRTLGEEVFNGFGFGYLQNHPSQSYTLNHLGQHFVGYLTDSRPQDETSADWTNFLIDLARLEWAIYEVFDGPGLESDRPLETPDLLALGRSDWLDLKIRTAPCLSLLSVDFPVNDHFSAVRASEAQIEVDFPQPRRQYLAITRREYIVRRYHLNAPQYVLLKELQQDRPLGDALERCVATAESCEDDVDLERDLPKWFHNWSAERCFFAAIETGELT